MKYKLLLLFITLNILSKGQKLRLELNLEMGKEYSSSIYYYNSLSQPTPKTTSSLTSKLPLNLQLLSNELFNKDSAENLYKNKYFRVTFKVINKTNNYYDMEACYDSLYIANTLSYRYLRMSSGAKKTDGNSTILNQLIKKPFSVKMSKAGRIIEVSKLDSLISSLIDKNINLDLAQKSGYKRNIISECGDSILKQQLELIFPIYSDSAVKKGEKWKIISCFGGYTSSKALTTYLVTELNEKESLIFATSNIITPTKDIFIESYGNKISADLEGTVSYIFKIDTNSGWIVRSRIEQNYGGNITVLNQSNNELDITMPVKINNKIAVSN